MANIKTVLDAWEVKDFEDNSSISVQVSHHTEMGNGSTPGLQVTCMGTITNYETMHVERWAYAAKKAKEGEYLLQEGSWMHYSDTYVKQFLVTGAVLKAKIEIKVRSKDNPVVKEYNLPFTLEM